MLQRQGPARPQILDKTFLLGALFAVAALLHAPMVDAGSQAVTTAAPVPESQRVRDFSDTVLAKIVPGHTAKPEVESLLGKPWRETDLDEESIPYPGDPSVQVWEYRGRNSKGTYRVHIEFDKHDVATLVAKIPDKAARAEARVVSPMANSAKP